MSQNERKATFLVATLPLFLFNCALPLHVAHNTMILTKVSTFLAMSSQIDKRAPPGMDPAAHSDSPPSSLQYWIKCAK